jgi:biotin-(acetyl-CoA carboxylase) ligase
VTGYDFHPSSILLETSRFVDYRDVLSAVIDAYNELLKQPKVAVYEEYKILSIVYNNRISIDGSEHLVVDITQNGDLVLDQATGPRVTPNEVSLTSWYDE